MDGRSEQIAYRISSSVTARPSQLGFLLGVFQPHTIDVAVVVAKLAVRWIKDHRYRSRTSIWNIAMSNGDILLIHGVGPCSHFRGGATAVGVVIANIRLRGHRRGSCTVHQAHYGKLHRRRPVQ